MWGLRSGGGLRRGERGAGDMGVEHLGIPGRLPLPGEEGAAALYAAARVLGEVAAALREAATLEEGAAARTVSAYVESVDRLATGAYLDARMLDKANR